MTYLDSKRIVVLEADRTLIQGYAGGDSGTGDGGGGGGGGAGIVGADHNNTTGDGGNGGDGLQSSILNGSAIYYAGGGGGSQRYTSDNSGSGGGGGGGAGGAGSTTGTIGTANFGGGGGSGGDSATATGGAGGSGIVIISYTTSGAPSVTSSVTSTTNGTKTVHTFLANGTFTPSASLTVEYLVVAGGGGGGAKRGGGGGGGGYRTATGFGVTAQSYSVTVGAGGAGGTSGLNAGADGTNSIFSSITSTGGGGGGSATNGITGGSGGGGGGNDSVGDKVGGAGTSSDVTPTDVPDNSILVEKDTAKRYWFDAESANTKTVDENFDSTGLLTWTELHDTYISIDSSSNERLDFNLKRDGTNDTAYHQLSSALSDSSWVMDFDITLSTLSQTGGADAICGYIGMASSFEADNSNSHDGMYLQIVESSSINRFQATAQNSQTLVAVAVSGGTQFTTVTPSTTTFYVRLIRNGNDLTVQFFSTSARTGTATEEKTHTVSGIAGLDYITIKNLDFSAGSVGSNAVAGYIDNLKIYDGVTSATTPATWTYEPNANSSPLFDTHNGTSSSHSTTITVASNDNRLLIAHVAHSSNLGNTATTVTSVTSNVSGAFTQLMTQNSDSTQNQKTDVWYLKAPATGAHTVTVVYSHSTVSRSIALTSLYNVDQTTPINLSSKAGNGASTGTPITVDITPTVKNSVLMALAQAQYSANTPSDTTIYMASYAGGGDFNISAQKKLSPTRDSVNTMSWSKNSALSWSIVAFEVIGV